MSEKAVGCVLRNPVDQELYVHIGMLGKGHILFPLKYPETDVRTSYNLSVYKEVASSLHQHVEQQIETWSGVSEDNVVEWSTDRWEEFCELFVAMAETYAEDYDFEYLDEESSSKSKEDFYSDIGDFLFEQIRENTYWAKNTYAAKLAIDNFLKDVTVDMETVFRKHTGKRYSDYIELEFAERCRAHIIYLLQERSLYESTV